MHTGFSISQGMTPLWKFNFFLRQCRILFIAWCLVHWPAPFILQRNSPFKSSFVFSELQMWVVVKYCPMRLSSFLSQSKPQGSVFSTNREQNHKQSWPGYHANFPAFGIVLFPFVVGTIIFICADFCFVRPCTQWILIFRNQQDNCNFSDPLG